jgi:hypothetical protein
MTATTPPNEVSVDELKKHVERLHHCRARFRKVVPVEERFQGQLVWDGHVHVFDLDGHTEAKACFAWSSPIEGSSNRRFYAVLQLLPISSAADAVRAAILADWKRSSGK